MTAIEERAEEEKIALMEQWRDSMGRQVHNIIVSTLEVAETMLEEADPASDPEGRSRALARGRPSCRHALLPALSK
jgi:hypothetical protein